MVLTRFIPLIFIAAVSCGAPAFAQDVSAPQETAEPRTSEAPAATEPEALMPEEVAFNARSAEMGEKVLAYDAQMTEAARLALSDPAAKSELDALQTRFQADIDAFIQEFVTFAVWKEDYLTEEEIVRQRRGVEGMVTQLQTVPEGLRSNAERAALAAAPAQTPAN